MRKLIESYNNGYGPGNGGNGNGAPGSGNNGGNGNNSNGGNGNGSPKRPSILMLILSGLMTVIVVLMLYNAFFGTNTGTEVSYTDFLKDLEADKVAAVEVNKESGMVTVQLKQEAAATPAPGSYVSFYGITQKVTQSQTVYYTMLMEDLDTLTARLQEHGESRDQQYFQFPDGDSGNRGIAGGTDLDRGRFSVPQNGRKRRTHGRGQEQCQGICTEGDRRYIQGCGR